jgi:Kef-type K+ transport system membrane component KefB
MENILLLGLLIYGVSLSFGYLLQRYLRIPWMFSALLLGFTLSMSGSFLEPIKSESFQLLSTLGMFILLFLIGFNLDLGKIKRLGKYVLLGTVCIIAFEGFFGSLLLYFVFPAHVSNSYTIALITALSFATVGEAILVPILAEFNVVNTTFGQLTLGIGTFDDIIEVLVLLAMIALLPTLLPQSQNYHLPNTMAALSMLIFMVLLASIMVKVGGRFRHLLDKHLNKAYKTSTCQLLILFLFSFFVAMGGLFFESLATVGAILSGIVARQLLPKELFSQNEKAINFLGYVCLSPFFFLNVGSNVSLGSLFVYPLMIILISLVATSTKLFASYIVFQKLLQAKYSLLLGLGLSVRFSTSLIVQYILLDSGVISSSLYSALVLTALLLTPIIAGVYSWFLSSKRPP